MLLSILLGAGEQQRLGMARLFFQRPAFGALDECTNATSADVEEALYAHARQLGITLVTVTQRTALVSALTYEGVTAYMCRCFVI